MIPKIIHYCWFGKNPLPKSAKKCISSWRKFLPDYEIKEWNESNFDVNIIPYTKEAYEAKKYAFVSDYARFWILYKYGGLYFDTDVEIIRPIDDIITKGSFMGIEKGAYYNRAEMGELIRSVAPGLGMGAFEGLSIYKEVIDGYNEDHFFNVDGTYNTFTIVKRMTKVLYEHGYKGGESVERIKDIWIYPAEYFCPFEQKTGKIEITENTRSIHHYDGTWLDNKGRMSLFIKKTFGGRFFDFLCKIKNIF